MQRVPRGLYDAHKQNQPRLQEEHSSPAMKVDRIEVLYIKCINNFLGAPSKRHQWLRIYTHFQLNCIPCETNER